MIVSQPIAGYSARVRVELFVAGQCIRVAQMGGGRLIFDAPVTLPGTTGEVMAHIDEHEQRWQVVWPASDTPARIIRADFREIC